MALDVPGEAVGLIEVTFEVDVTGVVDTGEVVVGLIAFAIVDAIAVEMLDTPGEAVGLTDEDATIPVLVLVVTVVRGVGLTELEATVDSAGVVVTVPAVIPAFIALERDDASTADAL